MVEGEPTMSQAIVPVKMQGDGGHREIVQTKLFPILSDRAICSLKIDVDNQHVRAGQIDSISCSFAK